MFYKNIWNLYKCFFTALINACKIGDVEIVKLLLRQEEIDLNAKDISFIPSMLISEF